MNTHVSTIPVVRDIIAANAADGDLVLVRLTPARAECAALASAPLALGMVAEDVIPTLLGEVKELEVELAEATADAFKDATAIGLYREALARIDAACDSGSSPAQLLRRTTAATSRLREGLAGLS